MSTFREEINAVLLQAYKKNKIEDFLKLKDEKISSEDVDKFYKELCENHETVDGVYKSVMIEYSDTYDISSFEKLKDESKRKRGKTFRIVEIEKLSIDIITSYCFGFSLKNKDKEVAMSDMTGLFKVHFSNGSYMYYSKWVSGGGKARAVEGMYAAEKATWFNLLKMMKQEKKKNEKPKNGIYRIFANPAGGIGYMKKEDLQETPIVHPSTIPLDKDMTYYFDNVEVFTRFGMPGVRKVLLVGPPGTGKTSLSIKIAKRYEKEKCMAFATSISDVAAHLQKCAKYNVSTLVILEDAESTLQQANSALLNFLDGVDLPKNLNGSYIIMTTNHPDQIESRILKRPGRIDKIIEFGNLTENYALQCADIYFQDILFDNKSGKNTRKGKTMREKLYPIVNNMSGAEIKELSQATASYAASENKKVDVELVETVRRKMKGDLQDISKYACESSSMTKDKSVGFNDVNDLDSVFKEDYLAYV